MGRRTDQRARLIGFLQRPGNLQPAPYSTPGTNILVFCM